MQKHAETLCRNILRLGTDIGTEAVSHFQENTSVFLRASEHISPFCSLKMPHILRNNVHTLRDWETGVIMPLSLANFSLTAPYLSLAQSKCTDLRTIHRQTFSK